MQVRLDVDFDDAEFSVTRREPFTRSTLEVCSGAAVMAMGQCVGRMIVTLMAGSSAPLDAVLEDFSAMVARSAKGNG